ncbi:nitrite reductase large subunit NirB [Luteipulveratus mongoliensis]|uniref:assimilatory sulfite reductase (ferredoxin) n=1 Tax=Luteipulveratus mongoliensis TaxID=571913 RepID=A0A0K1JFN0_9MICO|nr:nitrite reductase large subunit NirB [Luteipulveratus mongoliensis]AKU15527.1 nitrite reductase [Luteipulveratus mongoliensis]
MRHPQQVVVVGGGMVAHRFVEALRSRDDERRWHVTVLAEEPRPPYDRVALTSYFTGRDPEDLNLGHEDLWADPSVRLRKGIAVTSIDRDAQQATLSTGETIAYDHLVLATGSYAAVPPVKGKDTRGCFVYRTIDDVADLRGYVEKLRADHPSRPVRGAVIGGGLLGLEAAGALQALGAESTVVEFAPRLMPLQVDPGGGQELRRLIENLGVDVRVETATSEVVSRRGVVSGMKFADGERMEVEVVIFATGVRPRDELARTAGLDVGERGGVIVDDACATSDSAISAIGEVACIEDRVWGLVAPGYAMAEIAVDRLLGGDATFPGADSSTKLKLLGVDVASFGDAFATTPGALEIVYADSVTGAYKKLVVSDDAKTLLGGILVGDASAYAALRPMVGRELPGDPSSYIVPESAGGATGLELPDDAQVCSCNNVDAGRIRCAVSEDGCDLAGVKGCTKAGTSCGACVPLVKKLVEAEQEKAGITVDRSLCEHFAMTRAELFKAVQVSGHTTFTQIIERHGSGRGCDICKPVVGSILASLNNGHILSGEQATLQDTNDHVLANLQKDGTYSVVPRIPGGEVTPEGLIVIGEIARDFGLYTKITGGQRIDMFGARIDQLPAIWQRLVDHGFESGHAYGKSLRTVKSCVGSTWCRFGVQDSVGMAVELELRYRGLRSPHKLKVGVSGCARECAEARGKDVGVIATEKGWNLYVGGNGGQTPKHAVLLAEDLDSETLIRSIDRFFMYYIRTADRLQRTAPWLEEIEGGIEHVRAVVLEDSLGIADDLDRAMAEHVGAYRDEWAEVLADPAKLAKFTSFVNAPDRADASLTYVMERGQRRPANAHDRERAARGEVELITADRDPVVIAGTRLEVRS